MALLAPPNVGIRRRALLGRCNLALCRRVPALVGQAHPWLAVALGEGWRLPLNPGNPPEAGRPTISCGSSWSLVLGIWSFTAKRFRFSFSLAHGVAHGLTA